MQGKAMAQNTARRVGVSGAPSVSCPHSFPPLPSRACLPDGYLCCAGNHQLGSLAQPG